MVCIFSSLPPQACCFEFQNFSKCLHVNRRFPFVTLILVCFVNTGRMLLSPLPGLAYPSQNFQLRVTLTAVALTSTLTLNIDTAASVGVAACPTLIAIPANQ